MKRICVIFFATFLVWNSVWGQEGISDTLETAYAVADQVRMVQQVGLRSLDLKASRRIISVAGEGDVLKMVQTMPGIAAGSEGSSAFYVRGGNLGHNAVTLDGVRLFGYSHLLGLTTAFPNSIIKDVDFTVGGFGGDSYNMLASHTSVRTKDGNFSHLEGEGSVSNFILGGYVSAPLVKDVLSVVASARMSPLVVGINGYKVGVYDAFGKLTWRVGSRQTIRGSVFYSSDSFSYPTETGNESMGWGNLIGNLEWSYDLDTNRELSMQFSLNHYQNEQRRDLIFGGTYNELGMYSDIGELAAHLKYRAWQESGLSYQFGVRLSDMSYKPGSTKVLGAEAQGVVQPMLAQSLFANAYGEVRYDRKNKVNLLLAGRLNYYQNKDQKLRTLSYWRLNPEFSFSGRYFIAPWLGIEATYDYLTQYHHTLEGVPLGWSLDLLIPADLPFRPETSQQAYLGLLTCLGQHSLSLGAYYKTMQDLVYFSEPTLFFGSGTTQWVESIKTGSGTSKGIEFLYQKVGQTFNYHLAYTYSRTDRHFEEVNKGVPFYAKYDRPHVLNLTMDYLFWEEEHRKVGANLFFTYQSGHLESVKSAHYDGILPGTDHRVDLDYYEGINNFRLKDFMRLDVGCYAVFEKPRVTHKLNLGIYNVMNRHNIFSIFYDTEDDLWKSVSLFPIMPSISYQVSF